MPHDDKKSAVDYKVTPKKEKKTVENRINGSAKKKEEEEELSVGESRSGSSSSYTSESVIDTEKQSQMVNLQTKDAFASTAPDAGGADVVQIAIMKQSARR